MTYEVRVGEQLLERRLSAQEFKLLSYLNHILPGLRPPGAGDSIWGATTGTPTCCTGWSRA